jgi:hypothetical protein
MTRRAPGGLKAPASPQDQEGEEGGPDRLQGVEDGRLGRGHVLLPPGLEPGGEGRGRHAQIEDRSPGHPLQAEALRQSPGQGQEACAQDLDGGEGQRGYGLGVDLEADDVNGVGEGGEEGPEVPHVQGGLPGVVGEKPHPQKGQKGRQPDPLHPPPRQGEEKGHQDYVQGGDEGAPAGGGVLEAHGLGGVA